MTTTQTELLDALADSLFGECEEKSILSEEAKQEALAQAVYPLVCDDNQALQIFTKNMQVAWEQQELSEALRTAQIPFAVLKGLAASLFYPEPMNRTLGDVDLIVTPDDYHKACSALRKAGFTTQDDIENETRHVHFHRNGVSVELHRRYAKLNTAQADQLLDSWIYDAIPKAGTVQVCEFSFPKLPEPLNGLTLLAHISQHLEEGLGLRQLIDWVMYVTHELGDEKWPAFQKLAEPLGLTKLARVTARFGQLYLGLPEADCGWCADVDAAVCEALADYAFACGNFGKKAGVSNTVTMVLSHGSGIRGFFRNLQQRGESNWSAYQRHRWLRPFCWLYQAIRYVRLGLRRDHALSNLSKDYSASKRRNDLMKALGATRLVDKS